MQSTGVEAITRSVRILSGAARLEGELAIPEDATAVVLFAHGSGSSRRSHRNQLVARELREIGIGTLLLDLLSEEEEADDFETRKFRFDIELLAARLTDAWRWLSETHDAGSLPAGFFGASTGAAAALVAAARLGDSVRAIVARGGRPDLAGSALGSVRSPTLLLVGSRDQAVLRLNELAFAELRCTKQLTVIPGATHLFEEEGALQRVAQMAARWFERHLQG